MSIILTSKGVSLFILSNFTQLLLNLLKFGFQTFVFLMQGFDCRQRYAGWVDGGNALIVRAKVKECFEVLRCLFLTTVFLSGGQLFCVIVMYGESDPAK